MRATATMRCWPRPDTDPGNPGGFVVWVAIADVAHYVTPRSALDREARKRGNSTYFPDRVVPMLPDRLSGDLCSLHEGVDRACLAVRMVIDARATSGPPVRPRDDAVGRLAALCAGAGGGGRHAGRRDRAAAGAGA
jgi:hypothetical protein